MDLFNNEAHCDAFLKTLAFASQTLPELFITDDTDRTVRIFQRKDGVVEAEEHKAGRLPGDMSAVVFQLCDGIELEGAVVALAEALWDQGITLVSETYGA